MSGSVTPPRDMRSISLAPIDLQAHASEVLALHAALFPSSDSETKRRTYLDWLSANPTDGNFYLAAFVDGRLAGFLGFMARTVTGCGRRFRGALAIGAMTSPDFPGLGLYKRLAHLGWDEAKRRGFDLSFGYTAKDYVLAMELRMGWRLASVAPVVALPLDMGGLVGQAVPAAAPLAAPLSPLARALAGRRARSQIRAIGRNGYVLAEVQTFSSDYDDFDTALLDSPTVQCAKDSRTLNWLYLSPHNPFDYVIFEARHGGRLVGFAVGRRMDLRGLDGYGILDLVAVPGHEAVLPALAARVVDRALEGRPQLVAALASKGGHAAHALRSLGFIGTRQTFSMIWRPTGDDLASPCGDAAGWNHSWGNNDTV